MALNIVALFVYIFGAYAYGHLLLLSRHSRQLLRRTTSPADILRRLDRASVRLFAACAAWFVLHAVIEFAFILGEPKEDDLLDLATLELVFLFPALIFHTYLLETLAAGGAARAGGRWTAVLWALYAAGIGFAAYFTAAIFRVVPQPDRIGQLIGLAIATLFTIMSICALAVRRAHPRHAATSEQRQLGKAINLLFVGMILVFVAIITLRDYEFLTSILIVASRSTPLAFLVVSVYFENRIEFYDLIIKRGVLLLLTLVLTGGVLVITLGAITTLPDDATRPWVIAVMLLPVAMVMPWLHDRVGRLLDRLWFGRDFTTVEAVKHVLGVMQQAADEPALIAATQSALSDIFRRPVLILGETDAPPGEGAAVVEVRTATGGTPLRLTVLHEHGSRPMLSEDVALLRSLGSVFGYMRENVRLQRKRQEQEQVEHALRLQTSRSELKALRAQINPHFLFNALNAIASLIHTDPARADAAVEQLAEVFRYTLRRSEHEWAPLDQELAFARAYLDVEQARFGKRLEYTVQADEDVGRVQVPSMLLQTLVENAVKHGISRLRTPGRIDIRASRLNGRVTLEVRDTGPGLTAVPNAPGSGEHFGLRSVRDRLRGHFGDDASLDLRREGHMTVARLEMPVVEVHAARVHER